MNVSALVTDPLLARISIVPLTAPGGTENVTCVGETLVGTAMTLPSLTAIVPPRFVPVIVTGVPTVPSSGVIEEMVGGERTVNVSVLVAVPVAVVTVTGPVVAPLATVKVSFVDETTENAQATPPTVTRVVPVRSAPVRVTVE
jgi:hypothetical protein